MIKQRTIKLRLLHQELQQCTLTLQPRNCAIESLVTCTLSENEVSDIIDNVHVQILFTTLMFNFHVQMLFIVFMLKFQLIFS